ncbi:hypothetical protein JL720_13906 [Aureococcus anophagefferens]|nr:hypothetical protein JL720_13906 [Aureococcus anophagefferens]
MADEFATSQHRAKQDRKRARAEAAGAADDGEKVEMIVDVNDTVAKRIKACVLLEYSGLGVTKIMNALGMNAQNFKTAGWYEKYLEHGIGALFSDGRHKVAKQMTPNTKSLVEEKARKGMNAPDIVVQVAEQRRKSGDDREAPSVRTVRRTLVDFGASYSHKGEKHMVLTPWHARWRVQFAQEWLAKILRDPNLLKRKLFTDEKKFGLYDSRHGSWKFDDGEWNIAHAEQMTDARGLYRAFCWAGVGYNMKTNLMWLDQGETLKKDRYIKILEEGLVPRLPEFYDAISDSCDVRNTRAITIEVIQDNDPKHWNDQTAALFRKHKLASVASKRCDAEGNFPDKAPGPGGHMQTQDTPKFPCYSPDINSPIECSWRECQRRVLARAGEIRSRDQHIKIVEDEWKNLEFERSDKWCGINHLVMRTPDCLKEVIEQDGFDTSYMKH